MIKIIQFEEAEFNHKLVDFVRNFIEYSAKGYGAKLVSNETGEVIEDIESITGNFMLPWNDTFDTKGFDLNYFKSHRVEIENFMTNLPIIPNPVPVWEASTSYSLGDRITYKGKLLELKEVMRGGKMMQAFVVVSQ